MHVYNASPVVLKYVQKPPSVIRTGTGRGLELPVLGGSFNSSAAYQLTDAASRTDEGQVEPWPTNGGKLVMPAPEPKILKTLRNGWEMRLVIYSYSPGSSRAAPSVRIHKEFECAAGRNVVLLRTMHDLEINQTEMRMVAEATKF